MPVTIHQPNFIPRLKVLQKIACADRWVILDTVQYAKQEWQNRCLIVPQPDSGSPFWLTLPVSLPCGSKTNIAEVEVSNLQVVLSEHRSRICSALGSLPYFSCVLDYWDEMVSLISTEKLTDISTLSMVVALRRFARLPKMINSIDVRYFGAKSKLVASICRELKANEYLADSGAARYLEQQDFDSDIMVRWQDWDCQAKSLGLEQWRNTAFINVLARSGPDFISNHLTSPLLVDTLDRAETGIC